MKNLLPLLVFMLAAQLVFSQSPYRSRLFAVKFTPTSFFNPHYPTALIGVEYTPNDSFGIQFECGLKTSPIANEAGESKIFDNVSNRRYVKLKTEVRWYSNHPATDSTPIDFFLGCGLLFTPQSYDVENGTVLLKNGKRYSYSSAHFRRNAWSMFFCLGHRMWLTKRLTFEWYGGIGLKYTQINVKDMEDETLESESYEGGPAAYFDPMNNSHERDIIYPFADLGIKFGFAF